MHAENYYSFRYSRPVIDAVTAASSSEAATLANIEGKITSANQAYWQRQYSKAIDLYSQAASTIYGIIDPLFFVSAIPHLQLPSSTQLQQGFFSAAAEYLNVLPVNQPAAAPRPRTPVDPALLTGMAALDAGGINSAQITTAAGKSAVASLALAKSYTALGMSQTASFYEQQAKAEDASLVAKLQSATPELAAVNPPAAVPIAASLAGGTLRAAAGLTPVAGGGAFRSPINFKLPPAMLEGRTTATIVAGKAVSFVWASGEGAPIATITNNVYQARITLTSLPDSLLFPLFPSDVALALPHDYYYVIPLGLAECHHALGDYATAETYYLRAAQYQYLNAAVEAPYVWLRLAKLYLDWGNSLFINGNAAAAVPIYSNVVTPDWKVPTSQLYTVVGLKPGATAATAVIQGLPNVTGLAVNPQIIGVILDVRSQLLKIEANLDFWGHPANPVPIWTFAYLQQVASNFAQFAIDAERDVIAFWNSADQARLTRQQLNDAIDQANAQANAAQMQVASAQAQAQVYADGVTLAQQRQADANASVTNYAQLAPLWAQLQAQQSQNGGGDNGDIGQLNALAGQLMAGHGISGSLATLGAASGLAASYYNQQYQLSILQQQAIEAGLALTQAQGEQQAAQAAVNAAQAAADAATVRANDAGNDLVAFDAQTFTDDTWSRMGNTMFGLYQRYFYMALQTARLMQRAYNFETDQTLSIIKNSYAADEVNGLLGADLLMADIQSFTYDLVTGTKTKPQPIRQTISLAQRFAYEFETNFRKTGAMDFTTQLEDFDAVYPGTYAGRIETVEVAVVGVVPPLGVSGTLTNNGISCYRLPSNTATNANKGRKWRIQPKETLVISDYDPRQDALVNPTDQMQRRVFEGAGVASAWHIEIPPSINDIDYGAITDVKLTVSYRARYDSGLHDSVLTAIAQRAGVNGRQRGIPLRWIYPDAFFAFQRSGTLSFSLFQRDFPANERSPVVTNLAIIVTPTTGQSASGIKINLATPSHPANVTATTDATGIIQSSTAGSAWAPLTSGSALGNWQLSVTAANNPQLVNAGALNLASIANIALVLGYNFTPRK
jgi:hypothetical protein